MKRGIIRIIAGIIMVIFQLIPMFAGISDESTNGTNLWYKIGYYSVGITGAILFFWGVRVCSDGRRSQLIMHSKTKIIHTITRWVMFSISTLLFVLYVISLSTYWDEFNIITILMIFATLSFALYTLFYIHKKPCCLFSTALIFTGIAYLYDINSHLVDYILYLPNIKNYGLYIIFGIIPRLVTGILYIVIAVKLYNEKFSVNVIKSLGWTAFASEFSNRVLCNLIVFGRFYYYDIGSILLICLTVGILLHLSVFKINTLRGIVIYEDTIKFCRKCGEKLIDNNQFCRKCGTEIIKEPAVTVMESENINFCKKSGADITDDIDIYYICGEQKGTD